MQLRDALDFGNLAAARPLLGLNGQQGPLLAAGDHQLTVDVEAGNLLLGAFVGGFVLQYQLPEELIDVVELLETGGAVEQSEGVLADREEALDLSQIGRFGVVGGAALIAQKLF